MTLTGRLASYFPFAHLTSIAWTLLLFLKHPSTVNFVFLMFCIYLVPPLLFRMLNLGRGVRAQTVVLNRKQHCDWWIAHQMQMVYTSIPAIEALLRLIPGCYSAWLRLWGSRVGRRVYWTPLVELIDRHALIIGDDVIFGHKVVCSSHVITKKPNGELVLLLTPTVIGSRAFIGAGARIGPGVKIPENAIVPYGAEYRFAYAA